MKWKELLESKKIQLLVALLLVLVLVCACLVRSCADPGSDNGPNSGISAGDDATLPAGSYLATVTYVVNFPGTDEEPITFVQQAAPTGKAVLIPEVQDTEDTVWSGWVTEDGEPFDFDTVLTEDITICCYFYEDLNGNNFADGTASDPITVYRFVNLNGSPMLTQKLFGLDAQLDHTKPEYAFPQGADDGYIFLGWTEEKTVSEDAGIMTVTLKPEIASDRNNNDLVDGSDEDPYVHHIFLDQNGALLEEILWLDGEEPVTAEDVACPTTTKQKLVGWEQTESENDAGETVFTYTPIIEEY